MQYCYRKDLFVSLMLFFKIHAFIFLYIIHLQRKQLQEGNLGSPSPGYFDFKSLPEQQWEPTILSQDHNKSEAKKTESTSIINGLLWRDYDVTRFVDRLFFSELGVSGCVDVRIYSTQLLLVQNYDICFMSIM